ncbi:hypothetical protein H8B19_00895 [Neptunicella marina]|uniref:EF-hand domain-containing protein n=2 Tax=Neptunicella marina TaxID=2125989 RepID=A0A8J6IRS5_9ALTE|nr:hypothetical protein [Neptunicella marina]
MVFADNEKMPDAPKVSPEKVAAVNHWIARLDQDEDGKLTIKEAMADPVLLASFGKIDTNGDGQLSQAEMDKAQSFLQGSDS